MKKSLFLFLFLIIYSVQAVPAPSSSPELEEDLKMVKNMNPMMPGMSSMNMMMGHYTQPNFMNMNYPKASGDFGFENLRLSTNYSRTQFDDSSSGGSGHYDNYNVSISADLTEYDTITLGLTKYRLKLGGVNDTEINSDGISLSWQHSLNENWALGAFGLFDSVDIERTNGNTFSYAFGLLLSSYHSFEYFDLSSVTSLAYADFDFDHDTIFMTSLTASKKWTDEFGTFVSLSFTDSLRSDPEVDSTYGTWQLGVSYQFNENLSLIMSYQKTEFFNNYDDNTMSFDLTWQF